MLNFFLLSSQTSLESHEFIRWSVNEDENGLGYHIYDFSFSVSEDGVEEIIFKIFSDGGVC